MRRVLALLLPAVLAVLAGCEQLGIESVSAIAARKEADGKAVGGACRHAGRAIEDCYTLNRKADRAAVYAGWREMNDYMLENKIGPVVPLLTAEPAAAPKPTEHADAAEAPAKPPDKPAGKGRKQAS
jgi:hypothetical protein